MRNPYFCLERREPIGLPPLGHSCLDFRCRPVPVTLLEKTPHADHRLSTGVLASRLRGAGGTPVDNLRAEVIPTKKPEKPPINSLPPEATNGLGYRYSKKVD